MKCDPVRPFSDEWRAVNNVRLLLLQIPRCGVEPDFEVRSFRDFNANLRQKLLPEVVALFACGARFFTGFEVGVVAIAFHELVRFRGDQFLASFEPFQHR